MIFGIDPGQTGAIACIEGGRLLAIYDMPMAPDPKGRKETFLPKLLEILDTGDCATVWLERAQPMPRQGISSAFNYGQHYGALKACVAARGHILRIVTPTNWKRQFGLSKNKGVSRAEAARRFPANACDFARVKDDGRAEAALIALYGEQNVTG